MDVATVYIYSSFLIESVEANVFNMFVGKREESKSKYPVEYILFELNLVAVRVVVIEALYNIEDKRYGYIAYFLLKDKTRTVESRKRIAICEVYPLDIYNVII